jgi:acetyl-CoA carboxylase biotin carboxyl carrier protein
LPEPRPEPHADARDAATRRADHAAIERLADDLVPALIAKLGASGLGELEVREDGWRVRLRRAPDGGGSRTRRGGGERRGRGSGSGQVDGRSGSDGSRAGRDGAATNGAASGVTPVGPGRGGDGSAADPTVAASPAVGIYRPRPDLRSGRRVQAGDVLGAVEMLGVPQEVVAPADGIVGASLAEAGEAVEYGQPLVHLEFAPVSDRALADRGPSEPGQVG